ncbi:MAG: NAD(P)/FAD-dependent oxidoreductase [Dehalococcoidia bacterium]|nr:NAD(P)/FAD-dependent oxidoreductase [Dehalococcoidia bacterium]
MYDVIVVGAGPIGSFIASRLAELGYRVIALEQKECVGENVCCTGIISVECFSTFNLEAAIFRKANSAKFFAPCGQFIRLERENPQAYIIDRASLDKSLKQRAQRHGANYLFSASVVAVTPETDCVSATVDYHGKQRTFTAQAIILACGCGSRLPEKIGLGEITNFAFGAQAEVNTIDLDEVELYFDQNLFPGFFGWLVPTTPDKGLAGLLAPKNPAPYLRDFLYHLRAQGKIASTEDEMKFGTIPLGTLPRTYGDRIIAVGDAAGQVKSTTGGGICYGLLCADIAAECLHQAFLTNDFSAARLSSYDKQWRAKLNRELQSGYRARWFYKRLGNRHIDKLISVAKDSGIPQLVAEWPDFSFDWHGPLISEIVKHLAIASSLQPVKALSKHND